MKFTCEQYPSLRVAGVGKFANGELETDEPEAVAALTALAPMVQAAEGEMVESKPKRKRASKAQAPGSSQVDAGVLWAMQEDADVDPAVLWAMKAE